MDYPYYISFLDFSQSFLPLCWLISTSLLDYRRASQLAINLWTCPSNTLSRVSSPKHILDLVIPLLKTFHLLLVVPKTLWWFRNLYIPRQLLTFHISFLFSPLYPLSHCVAAILNFHWNAMFSFNTIPLHVLFLPPRILECLPLPSAPLFQVSAKMALPLGSFLWPPKLELGAPPLCSPGIS